MRVVVVGAGPAGATCALLLARHGVRVSLLERDCSFDRVFRGEGLMPLGMDALHQMGLGDVVTEIPNRLLESWNIYIDGEEAFVIPEPITELDDRAARVVSQPAFLERVVQAASAYPSFSFMRQARFRDVLTDDRNCVVGVGFETSDGMQELEADLVIGCDGRNSLVRTRAGLEIERLPQQYDVLWFKAPAPAALRGRCQFMIAVRRKHHPAVCYTSWDDRLQYGLILPKGGLQELHEKDWLRESMQPAPPWLSDHVLAHREDIEGPIRLNVVVGRCPRWTIPGLLLLGDAAHPMSPVRAQGINLAFRDAIVAANHLIPVLRANGHGSALDSACRAVQAQRQTEVVRAQKLQAREAKGQGDARSGSWRFDVTKRLARPIGRYRWAQNAWLRRQHDLRFGSVNVRLHVRP